MAKFNYFEDAIDFSFWREICENEGERIVFTKGDYFVRSGEVLNRVGWILSGGFKHSLTDNIGNRKSVGFVFEGSILANYMSAFLSRKMPTDIIALTDSEVMVVPASRLRDRLVSDPTLNIRFLQELFEQAYSLLLNDYRSTPEERYHQMMLRFPKIFELVSLQDIATFLNISRRQLHRFREVELKSLSSKND